MYAAFVALFDGFKGTPAWSTGAIGGTTPSPCSAKKESKKKWRMKGGLEGEGLRWTKFVLGLWQTRKKRSRLNMYQNRPYHTRKRTSKATIRKTTEQRDNQVKTRSTRTRFWALNYTGYARVCCLAFLLCPSLGKPNPHLPTPLHPTHPAALYFVISYQRTPLTKASTCRWRTWSQRWNRSPCYPCWSFRLSATYFQNKRGENKCQFGCVRKGGTPNVNLDHDSVRPLLTPPWLYNRLEYVIAKQVYGRLQRKQKTIRIKKTSTNHGRTCVAVKKQQGTHARPTHI